MDNKEKETLDKELNEETLENVNGGTDPTLPGGEHNQTSDNNPSDEIVPKIALENRP